MAATSLTPAARTARKLARTSAPSCPAPATGATGDRPARRPVGPVPGGDRPDHRRARGWHHPLAAALDRRLRETRVDVDLPGLPGRQRHPARPGRSGPRLHVAVVGTYRQIAELGGKVRRGETSVQVVFWKQLQARDPDGQDRDAEPSQRRTKPLLRSFRVFNAEQADHLPASYRAPVTAGPNLAGQAQDVLEGYLAAGGPALVHAAGAGPSYSPARDQITLPAPRQFPTREAYWSTAFHEAAHSTGHPSRLNRPGVAGFDHYGSGRYAREELVAEIGGAMLAAATGVATETSLRDDTAAYIAGWLTALDGDRKLVVVAASQAEHAADRVLEPQRQAQPRPEAHAGAGAGGPEPTAPARKRQAPQRTAAARLYLAAEPEAGG